MENNMVFLIKRRSFLKAISIIIPTSQIFRFFPAWGSNDVIAPLTKILRSLKNPVCEKAARIIENRYKKGNLYVLHLRHAMLSESDAKIISGSIQLLHKNHDIRLKSFSLSYNPNIGAEGATAILSSLPEHIEELGLVGCNLDDRIGSHIIKFIKQSKYLKLVCIEDNNFSREMRLTIADLKSQNEDCTIIV